MSQHAVQQRLTALVGKSSNSMLAAATQRRHVRSPHVTACAAAAAYDPKTDMMMYSKGRQNLHA
jgi:hypothetical protein